MSLEEIMETVHISEPTKVTGNYFLQPYDIGGIVLALMISLNYLDTLKDRGNRCLLFWKE